ncbi:MAG: VIT family protein [Lautropia sp.]|nr:VIT family protein [Lautropia sp.]
MNRSIHAESHYSSRNNWLRAGVLGANDGLISTASLLMGMVAAAADSRTLVLAGISAMVAGAVSMAAGEYVSVSSQADTEKADLHKERQELATNPEAELQELTQIYQSRGLDPALARQVAESLTRHDALNAHARDEIGISETVETNPVQAAWASALAFCVGAILPLLVVALLPAGVLGLSLPASTMLGLGALGWLSARLGGAPAARAVIRILLWGAGAMGFCALIGHWAGITV